MKHKETRSDALLLDTTVVRVPTGFPFKRKRVRLVDNEGKTFASAQLLALAAGS